MQSAGWLAVCGLWNGDTDCAQHSQQHNEIVSAIKPRGMCYVLCQAVHWNH